MKTSGQRGKASGIGKWLGLGEKGGENMQRQEDSILRNLYASVCLCVWDGGSKRTNGC